MAQVHNLLDMILNRVNPQSKSEKAATAKAFADATKSARAGLLPLDTSAAQDTGAAKQESFHAKVEAGRAKFSAKEPRTEASQFKPSAHGSLQASHPQTPTRAESSDLTSQNNARANQGAEVERSDRAKRANRQSRGGHKLASTARGTDGSRNIPVTSDPRVEDAGRPSTAPEGDQAAAQTAPDGKVVAALKDRLDKMGIHASDEQLNDPTFLTRLLQFLQSSGAAPESGAVPDSGAPEPEASATVNPDTAGGKDSTPSDLAGADAKTQLVDPNQTSTVPNQNQAQAAVASAAKSQTADQLFSDPGKAPTDPTANPSGKNLADLIKDRLGELGRQQSGPAETQNNPVPGSKPDGEVKTATPAAEIWRGVRVATNQDTAPVDQLPMGDLDKLRVIQASALQNPRNSEAPAFRLADDHDGPIDALHGTAGAHESQALGPTKDSSADTDAQPDVFGGKQEAQNAQAATGKDGAQAVKDGSGNPAFAQTLDQARSIDNNSQIASPRSTTPAHAPVETGVLDQISKKMSAAGIKGGDTINIQLEPEHLGKVRISLEMKDGGTMTARINVENENVRQIVDANLGNLRESLENQGIKLTGLEVSVDQQHSSLFNPDGSNSESFFQRQGRGGVTRNPNDTSADGIDASPESETGRRWGYNTMEYIA